MVMEPPLCLLHSLFPCSAIVPLCSWCTVFFKPFEWEVGKVFRFFSLRLQVSDRNFVHNEDADKIFAYTFRLCLLWCLRF
jgi:hypothetical protein